MEKYAPKLLFTAEPHYIPGYTGYCPQMRFCMGKSYARLTAELLASAEVKHSKCLVLKDHAPDPDNLKRMIPGYTGFIPKSRNYFSYNYSEICQKALTEFYQEKQQRLQKIPRDLPLIVNGTSLQIDTPKSPPKVTSDKVITYRPSETNTPGDKPHLMDDNKEFHISGFTGHVPRARSLIGKSYPLITSQALSKFHMQQTRDVPSNKNHTMPNIHPPVRGMVTSFTGHIPGYMFMCGHTFGQLSKDALEQRAINKFYQKKVIKTSCAPKMIRNSVATQVRSY
ncbi:ciliary microtubule inner protein 2B [Parambassis ranga]|uniref:Ciliary microtubule inner protein 2B n=1 Tax=Parambassis ranga TaxID=210632 RepID=A0A6P7JCA4_9TELE|nr:protein FAM166B-like [Parambassis ranga]